jgi:hypothetical protein
MATNIHFGSFNVCLGFKMVIENHFGCFQLCLGFRMVIEIDFALKCV